LPQGFLILMRGIFPEKKTSYNEALSTTRWQYQYQV
jgi:hypothetical protein